MPESGFHEQIQPHVGRLVRVVDPVYGNGVSLLGKIGLLLHAESWSTRSDTAKVKLLIDGSVLTLFLFQREIELIGADNA
jgi:hypothetical protein